MSRFNPSFSGSWESLEYLLKRALYFPTPLPLDFPAPRWAQDAEEMFARRGNGGDVVWGYYFAAPHGRPTILFFPGNGQTAVEWSQLRQPLIQLDCGWLFMDYPGYGKSTGEPCEVSLYQAALAAFDWLVDEKHLAARDIILFGKSLGGYVAVEVATKRQAKSLILESTAASIVGREIDFVPQWPNCCQLATERYDSINKIESIEMPLLIIHGDRDAAIPLSEAEKLYNRARDPKKLLVIEGAEHNSVYLYGWDKYVNGLNEFLGQKPVGSTE